jgi:ketosteroid isomerase-like protein
MDTVPDAKTVADTYYQAGAAGHLPAFATYLHPDFTVTAPDYLPWGGTHPMEFFRDEVLHHLPETLDFSRFTYVSLTAEGDHAVAAIDIGVTGTDDSVRISEHWTVINGTARNLWVAYFEPAAMLAKLGRPADPVASSR